MKKNKGATVFIIGMMIIILVLTVFKDDKMLQYSALILGLIVSIYSVYISKKY